VGVTVHWLTNEPNIWLDQATGDVPVLLTFAHAGERSVDGIAGLRADPHMTTECAFNNSSHDARTREIAEAMLEHMDWRGLRPYVVIPDVSRQDIDLNRSWAHNQTGYVLGGVSAIAQNQAQKIYDGFYGQIQTFMSDIGSRFLSSDVDRALLIDVHGDEVSPGADMDIGTRQGKSADASIVYTNPAGSLTIKDAIAGEGFALRTSPGPTTEGSHGGCWLIRVCGREFGGFHAVQWEMSPTLRGSGETGTDAKRAAAFKTGARLATALEKYLVANNYPVMQPSPVQTQDDYSYAALML
jgi:N-formylglutamate amidohydrolase